MKNSKLGEAFLQLSTPLIMDACLRLKVPAKIAATGIHPIIPGSQIAGRALPARHFGSVDVFLEAMVHAAPGDILVIDNDGRPDEGCIGDLIAMDAQFSQLAGIIIWGCHRDTKELTEVNLPIFSYGSCPAGPQRLDPRDADALTRARFGQFEVRKGEAVFADDDGVVFVADQEIPALLETALSIQETERRQALSVRSGNSLRAQFRFDEYLAKRSSDPSYTFRHHLREIGGAVEE